LTRPLFAATAQHAAGGGVTERVRGGATKEKPTTCRTRRCPRNFRAKSTPLTPYVIGKIVSRLEMDSRWALARSVRALVAERDALKENLKAVSRSNRQEVEYRAC
jgi:hypothetical protein